MMAGIMVGITVLTTVLSAGMGARERIMERVRVFGLENIMIWAGGATDQVRSVPGSGSGSGSGSEVTATLKLEDAEAVYTEIQGIRLAAPFARSGQSEAQWRDRNFASPMFGVTPEWVDVWDWPVGVGSFITQQDVESNPFEIVGIMAEKGTSAGGGDMDNRIFVPLSTYMRRVANVDYLSGIRVQVRDVREMEETATDIEILLRERHGTGSGVPDDFRITTPTEVTAMVEEMQGTFNLFLILVSGIALIVGGVVVANIMLLSVSERRREIGLRRAVGASSGDIRGQFLLESAGVTFLGGIAGLLLGLVVNILLERFTGTPALMTWHVLAAGLLFSTGVGLTAGLHPARKAAAMPPVDALRS